VKSSLVLVVLALAVVISAAAPAPSQTPAQTSTQTPAQPPAPQTPATQTPATAATPQTPPPAVPASRKFTSDAGMMISVIKADKTADFEAIMGRIKEALAKSQDPKRKQQALNWRVYKGLEAGPGGNVVYIWWLDPPAKDVEYTVTDILREAFPNEAQDLWTKYIACFVSGQTMLNLQLIANMSPNATAIVK
jgi:pyruvate/2-oxoglutarate dehydrogenase complex dihydrolipoamide acyltransferase (E2) component